MKLLQKYALIRPSYSVNFPLLLKRTQICAKQGTTMPEKLPSSSHFGGNHKTDHFYPKIRTQPVYSGADSETKDNKYLYISVTYGV